MEAIDIKALEEAVVFFYRSNSNVQAFTHEWLTKAQNSPQAWSFCWELLHPAKSQEVQFFGAVTLHSKLIKYWHEVVPEESREQLKQKLLESIVTFANGPKLVLNRLCISLSAFIVHMFRDWQCAIEEVLGTFQNQQIPNVTPEIQTWIMFEILAGIPEESNSVYTSIPRALIRGELNKKAFIVMKTIEKYLEAQIVQPWTTDNINNMIKAVVCVGSWIKNGGYQIDNCQNMCDLLLKLVNKSYWISFQGDGCMSAEENELAEICLKILVSIMIQPESHRYPKTAFSLIKMFLESLCEITKSEWKENNLNEDIASNIYSLIISSVERHSKLLLTGILTNSLEHRELFTRLVNEILSCTGKPGIYPVEESCSILSFGFWYMLQEEVFSLDNTPEKAQGCELIKPIYAHLTATLLRKARQPDEKSLEKWNSDELEIFRCYRQDISDTLMFSYDVLKSEILEILSSSLNEALIEIQNDPNSWTNLEACIFAFQSVSDNINSAERKFIPKFIQTISELPYDKLNDKMLGTALEAIGRYCSWLKENQQYLPLAITLMVNGLNSSMTSQATLGLKELCRECQIELKPFVEPLLDACQNAIKNGQLKNTECVRLMYPIGKLLSMLPSCKIPSYLDTIVSPCFEELQIIVQSGIKNEAAKIRTCFRLRMISTLFTTLQKCVDGDSTEKNQNDIPTLLIVIQKTMPIFKEVLHFWLNEFQVIEIACNAFKYAIPNLGDDFKPMLKELCYLIIFIFQSKSCSPALELAKTCIIQFSNEKDSKNLMQQLLVQVHFATFQLFENAPEKKLSDISDVIEAFYCFEFNLVRRIPISFTDTNIDLQKLISFTLEAITLPESGPIKNALQFLTYFINNSVQYPTLTQVITNRGEEIIKTSLLCIGCHTPRNQVEKFSEIFLSLNRRYPKEFVVWMRMLENPDFPSPIITNDDKMKFMSQVLREKTNKRLMNSYIQDFAAKCRGLIEKV